MPIHLETLAGYNHPNDKIEQDRKNASIYHRFVGSLDKSFKFKYHEFNQNGYNSLESFNELGERKVLDDYWLPYITKDSVVVDVGASYGIYTLASLLAGATKVYAFEPVKMIADSLKKNIDLNEWWDRIEVYNRLLWSTDSINVKFDDKTFTTANLPHDLERVIETESISLDSLNLDRVDIIKIDVEGVELDILYGAIQTIYKSKPYILIELHSDSYGLKHVKDMVDYFFNISIQRPNTRTYQTIKKRDYMFVEFD